MHGKNMKVYINGKYYDKDDAKVSVFDHGFLYGDGICSDCLYLCVSDFRIRV